MGIFTGLNNMMGKNTFPPTKEIADRWEWIAYWSGLRDNNEIYVRNEAIKRGMGGRNRQAYIAQPVPRALSQASANLLFGEPPTIKAGNPDDQERLDAIIGTNKLFAQCRAAAITSSSEGGVYLKVSIDPSTPRGQKVPLIQFIEERRVIPNFQNFSELVSATVITNWQENNKVYRLMENHIPGYISYELYAGGSNEIGLKIPLANHPKTAGIEEEMETGVSELLVSYIPNSLNTNSPFGVSDYANGIDDLFFAFNDATSIAHRATQSGVPLTVLPRELLDENQSLNHEKTIVAVNKLADTLGEGDVSKMIETVQHNAQQDKFMSYAKEVLDLLLIFSGISPQSIGRSVDGGATSGTALKLKMSSTLSTAAGKAVFYEDSLAEMLRLAAILDTETFGDGNNIKEAADWTEAESAVSVKLDDGLPDDEIEMANIIQRLKASGAISLEQAVRKANPHMTDEQVEAEIDAIRAETQAETAAIGEALPTTNIGNILSDITAEEL